MIISTKDCQTLCNFADQEYYDEQAEVITKLLNTKLDNIYLVGEITPALNGNIIHHNIDEDRKKRLQDIWILEILVIDSILQQQAEENLNNRVKYPIVDALIKDIHKLLCDDLHHNDHYSYGIFMGHFDSFNPEDNRTLYIRFQYPLNKIGLNDALKITQRVKKETNNPSIKDEISELLISMV